jgi:hypothetical protein
MCDALCYGGGNPISPRNLAASNIMFDEALVMEAAGSSVTMVRFYHSTGHRFLECNSLENKLCV